MKVLIVDDHTLMLMIVSQVIAEQFPGADQDRALTLGQAIEKASGPRPPDIVLLDLGLPDSRGPETAARFHAANPRVRIIVLTADDDFATVAACRKAGVAGYLLKTALPKTIGAALRAVANGGTWLPVRSAPMPGASSELTQRQLEVLRLIARGLANKDIARSLGIAENTVKGHARDAYAALGVSSRVQALRALAKLGIPID